MKRVRALLTAPPKMNAFVHALNGKVATTSGTAKELWGQFRKSRRKPYPELILALAAEQRGLCACCETRLTTSGGQLLADGYEVDHVLPKSLFPALTLEASNLLLSCKVVGTGQTTSRATPAPGLASTCGSAKAAAEIPNGLEPRVLPLQPAVFVVGLDGRMQPNAQACLRAGVSAIDAEHTLQLLNLNAEPLPMRRQSTGDAIRTLIAQTQTALEGLAPETKRVALRTVLERIAAKRLAPDTMNQLVALWSTERAVLGAAAEQYLAKNPVY